MRAIVFGRLADLVPRAHAVLGRMGYRVVPLESFDQLRPTVEQSHPDDIFVAAVLDDQLSFQVSELLRRVRFRGRVLVLVEHLGHPGAAPLLQLARSRCALRPVSAGSLDTLLEQAVRWHEPVRDGSATPTFYGLVGRSDAMLSIFRRLEKIAASDANVCIYGESGTGKELVSRAIHLASPRGEQPFVTLDCTAVPEGLMESHLFGHVKGAFTGATDHREGVFSLANMGTLFIDELSDLSLPLQAKLLRVIQTREFTRVGGAKPIRTNIRLVTAMNKDPKRAVDEGSFREDLYYRVAVVMLRMPPLRERRDDIPLLIEHFLRRLAAAYQRPPVSVTPAALDRIMQLPWPGNVRQLEHFVEQAFVLSEGDVLTERDFFGDSDAAPERSATRASGPPTSGAPLGSRVPPQDGPDVGLTLWEVERRHILSTLEAVRGSRTEAARRLGISVRTLQYRLKEYRETGSASRGKVVPLPPPASRRL